MLQTLFHGSFAADLDFFFISTFTKITCRFLCFLQKCPKFKLHVIPYRPKPSVYIFRISCNRQTQSSMKSEKEINVDEMFSKLLINTNLNSMAYTWTINRILNTLVSQWNMEVAVPYCRKNFLQLVWEKGHCYWGEWIMRRELNQILSILKQTILKVRNDLELEWRSKSQQKKTSLNIQADLKRNYLHPSIFMCEDLKSNVSRCSLIHLLLILQSGIGYIYFLNSLCIGSVSCTEMHNRIFRCF